MAVTIPVVAASNPATLSEAATGLRDKIGRLDAAVTEQQYTLTTLAAAWEGAAASAALAGGAKTVQRLTELRPRLQTIQRALSSGGTGLSPLRRSVVDLAIRRPCWAASSAPTAR